MDPQKRYWLFFELAKNFPEVEFVAVGKPNSLYEELYERIVERYRGLRNLKIAGFVSEEEKSEILSRSWILCLPSIREGLPIAFLEALAHKCTLLSSVNPDNLVKKYSYWTEEDDFENGLRLLLEYQKFRALGIYPYEWTGLPIIANSPKPFDLFTRVLMKVVFTLADEVSVRDGFSKRVLIALGITRKIGIEEDLAFRLKPSSRGRALQILSQHGVNVNRRPLIGVNLRTLHQKVRREIVSIMSNFLDWLVVRGAELVFVPFGYGSALERFFYDDLIIANELRKHMKNGDKLKVIDVEYTPQVNPRSLQVLRYIRRYEVPLDRLLNNDGVAYNSTLSTIRKQSSCLREEKGIVASLS